MYYLTAEELRDIFLQIQLKSSSSFIVPDIRKLESIVDTPKLIFKGQEMYPTVYSKGAALMEAIIRLHYFVDGNKRVALQATERFLEKNNIIVVFPLHSIKFSLYIASSIKESDELRESIRKYLETYTIDINNVDKSVNNIRIWKNEFIQLNNLIKENPKEAENTLNCWLATKVYPENKENKENMLNNHLLVLSNAIMDYYLLSDDSE